VHKEQRSSVQSVRNVPGRAQKVVTIPKIVNAVPGTFQATRTFNR
jgi:hypothetical protein